MFYYYQKEGNLLASFRNDLPFTSVNPADYEKKSVTFLVEGDPILGRGRFRVNCAGQLLSQNGLDVLDESRLPKLELDGVLSDALANGTLSVVNMNRPNWEDTLVPCKAGKKRVNILAIGDVGSTLLTGLKLMGGDVISSIGICDLSQQITDRWEFEMGQISVPWDYDAMPEVEVITPDQLFDCDMFVFVASRGIPPVGSKVKDVRMAQFELNSAIVKQYAQKARVANFKGIWAAVSDPVDPLAKTAYLESNRDENGTFDGKGLSPEQVHGYGLGVMNARAAYFAKRIPHLAQFLTEGRSFGPHGTGLFVANSLEHYDEALSQELTQLTVTANLKMREIGFKPYVAPALSSGAFSLLLTLRGEWHCGSVFLDGIYMGVKNRYTTSGVETELLPHIPDQLFAHIQEAADHLKEIL